MQCKNCSSETTAVDNAQGVIYCTTCGMVQEESIIVNTINFNDDGFKSTLNGKIVDMGSKQVGTQYVDASYYIKNTISSICSTLGLGNQFVDCGYRYYRLLLPYNLSKGKSILYTLSACVYIVCREEHTPHLLIDFSNSLNIDVFKIGKSFSKIVEILNIKIPNVDPTLYIQRYIAKLELKNPKISSLALRIISRMNRDWITTGRRPNNLCGVSILIASRVYNEERTIFEVAKVVHVSEMTLKKRLVEISETQTADLSIDQFNKEWLTKEEDPPVIKNVLKKKFKDLKYEQNCSIKCNKEQNYVKNVFNNDVDFSFKNENEKLESSTEDDILTENEFLERKQIWEGMYEEYMIEKAEKAKNIKKPKRKNIKKQYNTVSDVLKSMNKRISSKINYNVIESIFDDL